MKILLATTFISLSTCVGAVDMMPPDGGSCWNSTLEMGTSELLAIFDPSIDLSGERVYTICPNTVIPIGTQMENSIIHEGGDFPLFVFNPNVHIQCGESGESANDCVLVGGRTQLLNFAGTEFLQALIAVLPTLLPNMTSFPQALPDGYAPDSSNLNVKGLTLEGATIPDSAANVDYSAIFFSGPGTNMLVEDCILRNTDPVNSPAYGLSAIYFSQFQFKENELYISLTVRDSIFENNALSKAVLLVGWSSFNAEIPYDNLTDYPMKIDIEGCSFANNAIVGNENSGLVVIDGIAEGSIQYCCFTDNIMEAGASSMVYVEETGNLAFLDNFGENNTFLSESICQDIAIYGVEEAQGAGFPYDFPFRNCSDFDASECLIVEETLAPTLETTPATGNESPAQSPTMAPVVSGTTTLHKWSSVIVTLVLNVVFVLH